MNVVPTSLPGVLELQPQRFGDDRGWFSETYKQSALADVGIHDEFVQDNESFSAAVATLRGIHYQVAPHPQAKLVRVIQGSIFDVAVDLRRSSPTFGHHVAVTLSAQAGNQLYVPVGFGHGFCTLEPNCRIAYKVSGRYAPDCERAVIWNDPDLAIDWPVPDPDAVVLSAKDQVAPTLATQPDLL